MLGGELAVDVTDLSMGFGGRPVFESITLRFAPGTISVVLGPNGAGKTTLFRIMVGLLQPDSGSVRIGTLDPRRNFSLLRRIVGYCPQEPAVYPMLTVAENLAFFGRLARPTVRAAELDRLCAEAARQVDLDDARDIEAGRLSGGQQRRLHNAIALLGGRDLLVLDEPTVGADIDGRDHIILNIRRLRAEGKTVVYSTHDLHDLARLGADQVVVLASGRARSYGSLDSFTAGQADIEKAYRRALALQWPDPSVSS